MTKAITFPTVKIRKRPRVGLFGVGLAAYWPQFPGLKERLEGYIEEVRSRLCRRDVEVLNFGLVDTPTRSFEVGHEMRETDVDIIFIYVTTYTLSATVMPIVRRAKVPVVVLNLQPAKKIDYVAFNELQSRQEMTGEWLAYCSACPLPEIANVFQRFGIDFHQVTGVLGDDPACWSEIDEWLDAAKVVSELEHNTLGLLGHYYSGMLDIYSDLTSLSAVFGGHIEIVEVDELAAGRKEVTENAVAERAGLFQRVFDMQSDCDAEDISQAARTSVALDQIVDQRDLGSIAYFYKGTGSAENELAISSIILGMSLLNARGIPAAGEYEVKNVLAMKILATLGAGGSFTEIYAIDFDEDIVLMGHDGPGHCFIAQGKTKVRPLGVYHGKVGRGLSVEMSVQHGPVTLLSIAEDVGRGFRLIVAEGESVAGPTLQIGNTNSRYRFPIAARQFISEWSAAGPAHHCAVGVGHVASTLEKVGSLLKIPFVRVC